MPSGCRNYKFSSLFFSGDDWVFMQAKFYVYIFAYLTSAHILRLRTLFYVLNDLTGAKVLIDERILCNAVKDTHFASKMKFEKLGN
jgi:hypothetical protein